MNKENIVNLLQALAVGDSFGKSTEFASRSQILQRFSSIDTLLQPTEALAHKDMRYAQVTDDTEQNFFLIEDYTFANEVSAAVAAKSLLRWYDESPEPEKYIGPSTSCALKAIRAGADIRSAGKNGHSCGGVMRVPAAFLCSSSLQELQNNIVATLLPTHNTSAAMEAAMGYGYALWEMLQTRDLNQITQAAIEGCTVGRGYVAQEMDLACLPSCVYRLRYLVKELPTFKSSDDLLDFLFYVFGTTISSCDVFVASFALFFWAKEDTFQAIRLAAMLGGDTDTIACLAAVLCCAYAGKHNIPADIVQAVERNNTIDFSGIAEKILEFKQIRGAFV